MFSDQFSEIEKCFENIDFSFSSYECENNSLLKVSRTNEISDMIDDCLATLYTLNSNLYIDQFKEKINILTKKLTISKSVISTWLDVQSLWTLLKPIFSQDDIVKLMPNEVKKFSQINQSWLLFMKKSSEVKNVISICYEDEGAEKFLIHLFDQIQESYNSLSFFLNLKREEFPRFYFVSDKDLLEILSQRSNPQSIQRYLPYIFEYILYLNFDYLVYNKIIGFQSRNKEIVNFKNPFFANGNIEKWLNDFVDVMKKTLRDRCSEMAQQMMAFDVEKWINLQFPAQILNLSLMFWLTYRTEDSLRKTKNKNKKIMKETLQEFETRFKELVRIRYKIDKQDLLKKIHVDVLITLFLNNLDIFRHLVLSNIMSIDHADWQNQLRYYWNLDDKKCIVSIANVDREYSFEYFCLANRLIITPSTINCYSNLSKALDSFMGGAIIGQVGTGKVEILKDLAKSFGVLCMIFNCSDQMNHQIIDNFLKGLAESGVWGCFDEFNRIKSDVLSIASQHIECILNACREKSNNFKFTDSKTIKLDNKVGIFISMNSNYSDDNQELPENLKNNFRMIKMVPFDKRLFIRYILVSTGFTQYEELSYNFAFLYQLCSEKLSKQSQNNWNLRNILFISYFLQDYFVEYVVDDEIQFLICVLKNMNLPKLNDDDKPTFLCLLYDAFKGVRIDLKIDNIVQNAIIQYNEKTNDF